MSHRDIRTAEDALCDFMAAKLVGTKGGDEIAIKLTELVSELARAVANDVLDREHRRGDYAYD